MLFYTPLRSLSNVRPKRCTSHTPYDSLTLTVTLWEAGPQVPCAICLPGYSTHDPQILESSIFTASLSAHAPIV